MNLIHKMLRPFQSTLNWFLRRSLLIKGIIVVVIVVVGWLGIPMLFPAQSQRAQYQTSQAEKGTLIVSVTGSGQVSTSNSASITTQATGVVSKLLVANGDTVKAGDPIAEIDLDENSKQSYAQATSSYQSAKSNLDTANSSLYSLQSDMMAKWKSYMDTAQNNTYQNADGSPNDTNRALPDFYVVKDNWLASEAKYKNQQTVIAQAQSALNSAWLSYKQASPTIYAPISGKITGVSLQVGSVISGSASSSSNSSSTSSSTKIGSIITDAMPTVSISLTEIDVPKITIGNKATITFDAIADKTFTGEVISIDTVGSVSSGVTSYPVVIKLDTGSSQILSNMNASASIITNTKDNALLIPSSAVQTQSGESTVRILKNNTVQYISVETGLSSDTQTEILSGISEGDTVVTSITTSSSSSSRTGTSVFGGSMGGARSGTNVMRIGR